MIAFIRRQRWLVGVLLLAGCRDLVDPALPDTAVSLNVPAVYTTWWSMTEACSGIHAPMSAIQWLEIPDVVSVPYPGRSDVQGYWSLASNRIVLAGNFALDGALVRHEMLHALLRRGGHPRDEFLGACAGVVDCNQSCIDDAGPAPAFDPTAVPVTDDDLEVAIAMAPAHPSAAVDDGFFTVTVRVTNPRATPVVVTLPPTLNGTPVAFSYLVTGPRGGVGNATLALDSTTIEFAPHETKVQVFDFAVGDSLPLGAAFPITLPAGTYVISGAYGGRSVSETVVIGP